MCDIISIIGIGVISGQTSVKVAREPSQPGQTGSGEPSRLLPEREQSGAGRLIYIDLLA